MNGKQGKNLVLPSFQCFVSVVVFLYLSIYAMGSIQELHFSGWTALFFAPARISSFGGMRPQEKEKEEGEERKKRESVNQSAMNVSLSR